MSKRACLRFRDRRDVTTEELVNTIVLMGAESLQARPILDICTVKATGDETVYRF